MHFELLCHWDFVTFLLGWACGPRITVISTGSISLSWSVLVSSVSSRFLEGLLNEASASGAMQQPFRKASCGRCPWDEPDPYLGSQLQGDYPGTQLCTHSCTAWAASRPFSCVVKPARKQGLNCSGKSTMLLSTLYLFFFNWLTIRICQAQKNAALWQVCVIVLENLQQLLFSSSWTVI